MTIRHEEIPGVMGPMTMRFGVESAVDLGRLAAGARVRFRVRRTDGHYVVTHVEPFAGPAPAASAGPAPGVHDHTPHHGGVVGMAGEIHLEAMAAADGAVRLYLSDFWRYPLPVGGAAGTVTLELPDGDRTLRLDPAGDALEARGPRLAAPEVTAHFAVTVDGRPVEMDFLLPVGAGRPGAAGVPVRGCVPLEDAAPAAGRRPRCTLEFARAITFAAATPDGATVLIAGVDLGVSAWTLPMGRLLLGFSPPPPLVVPGPEGLRPHPEAASAIALGPDGTQAIVALEGRLLRYETATGRVVRELAAPRGVLRTVAWSPDGERLLVTTFYDVAARLLRADDGSEQRRLPVEREGAAVAFAPDGGHVAVGSDVGPIALYDLAVETAPRILTGPHGPLQALVFVDRRLVSAGDDGVVRVWDVEAGTLLGEARTGTPLARLALAPDRRRVASAGVDGRVRLHEVERGAVVETLDWHQRQVLGLAWAGTVLVSGDTQGRVALWDLSR